MNVIKSCVSLVMCFQLAVAQNLVPDSSFEQNKFVPMDFSALRASHSWTIPSWGTTDLFCKCDRKTKQLQGKIYSEVDVPQNPMGNQSPHSGTCYAGAFFFSHGDYREYLQTPLREPLQKNKTYLFTMYLSLADYSSTSIDQLGVCFLTARAEYHSADVITDLDPVYMTIEREIGRDINNWHRVTVTYKAHGGESYLLFGSFEIHRIRRTGFKAPKEVRSRINQRTERDAYYFIDDVSLVETYVEEPIDTVARVERKAVKQTTADTLLVLKNVLFETNEATLLLSSHSELDEIVGYLKKNPHYRITISGHTDNSGNEPANKKLSKERAKAVADYLVLHAIDKSRTRYKGYGSSKPVATNETEEGRKQNRRVECVIDKK